MKYLGTSTIKLLFTLIKSALDKKANTADIPSKISELTNDSGYITTEVVNKGGLTGTFEVPDI